MSKKEDFAEITSAQKKNREKLDSYQEKLRKELEDLKTLAGEEPIKNSLRNTSRIKLSSLKPPPSFEKMKNENLAEENSILRTEIESLKNRIYNLENENSKLKTGKANISTLENEINSLREMITVIAQEKESLEHKIVEVTSTEKSSVHKKIDVTTKEEVLTKEKVPPQNIREEIKKPKKKPKKKKKKLSSEEIKAIKVEQEEKTPVRRRCPTCLNLNTKYIREMLDKTNIIMQSPRMYGKKFKCGICGTEWK